jgi:DNA-binding NarL/FixJ family response regulator
MTTTTRIRVVIVDDQVLVAEGLARIVAGSDDLAVVGMATGPDDLPALSVESAPHVVLLDYRLADDTGYAAVPAVAAAWPKARVLLVTGYPSEHTRSQARTAGCAGFVSKGESSEALLQAIRAIARGEDVGLDGTAADGEALTARELEVLGLLAEGRSAAEIAEQLFIGVVTVRNHVQRILRKLDASTQLEAVIVGMRRGFVDPPAAPRERVEPDVR